MRNDTGRPVSPCRLYQVPLWGPPACVLFACFVQLVALLLHQSAIAHPLCFPIPIASPYVALFVVASPVVAVAYYIIDALSTRVIMPPIGVSVLTGFDIIAQKIKDAACEHAHTSSATVAASMRSTCRLLGSSFQAPSFGRAKVVARDDPVLTDTRDGLAKKRRRTGCVTPASASVDGSSRCSSSTSVDGSSRRSSSTSVDGSAGRSSSGSVVSSLSGGSSTIASPTNLFRQSMPLDDDVVPPHRPIVPSVTMPILKRLLPEDIVELSAGASIIIVIPPTSRATSSVVRARRQYYSRAFDRVIEASCAWMRDSRERDHYIDECARSHRLQRDGATALQYRVRVSNYAERALFEMESPDKSQINLVWNQGAGINVVVCNYSRARSVLLQFKDIAFLEVHRLSSPVDDGNGNVMDPSCLNSRISFPFASRPENLVGPFLRLIEAVHGCRYSTIETLWKYYRAEGQATQRQTRIQAVATERALSTQRAMSDATALASTLVSRSSGDVTFEHFRGIKNELNYANVTAFSFLVDDLYRRGFQRHYGTFSHMNDYIVNRNDFLTLYDKFVTLFPYIHSVFGLTVSSSRARGDRVALSSSFDALISTDFGAEADAFDQSDSDDSDVASDYAQNHEDGDESDGDGETEDQHFLGKKERAVMEFFLAMLRLRSQKTLGFWSIVSPLAHYVRGQSMRLPKHPLYGSGTNIHNALKRLDQMRSESLPGITNLISNQMTGSLALDNFQQMISKKVQTGGSSSTYHRAVAYFVKRDKAILLPIGAVLRSPSGILFRVESSRFVDAYETVLTGVPHTYLFPLLETEYVSDSTLFFEVTGMQQGLPWPRIGWELISLDGTVRQHNVANITYVNQTIPPPFRACIHRDQDLTSMLFMGSRRFVEPGTTEGRTLTTDEYHRLIVQAQTVLAMRGFATYLSDQQHWREEIRLMEEEDGEHQDQEICSSDCGNVPRDVASEDAFVKVMQLCSSEVWYAITFQRDIIRHLYPQSRVPDKYHCFPLIPRDETSNDGMLMTALSVCFSLGLLEKMPSGNIRRGLNVGKQKFFLFGDVMTTNNWKRCYGIIFNKYAQLGNEEYVKCLLDAYDSVFVQRGYFHQSMHQLGVIYSIFFGGFMQAILVGVGDKRIGGDPVKRNFQKHENFAIKLFKSCERLMLRVFVRSHHFTTYQQRNVDKTNIDKMVSLVEHYVLFTDEWEESAHEPSRLVALYVKTVRSYLRGRSGTKKHDTWLMEKESCDWLGPWHIAKKNQYLTEQCEFIETYYDETVVSPMYREIMRSNSFCVMPSGKSVAFDEANEMYNMYIKKAPPNHYLDVTCKRSGHVMLAIKCASELYGLPKVNRESRYMATTADDVQKIDEILSASGLFQNHDATPMTSTYFWEYIVPATDVGTAKDKDRATVEYDDWEQALHDRINGTGMNTVPVGKTGIGETGIGETGIDETGIGETGIGETGIADEDDSIASADTENDVRSMASSVEMPNLPNAYSDSEDDGSEGVDDIDGERLSQNAIDGLKKIGNSGQKSFNKLALSDLFKRGKLLLSISILTKRKKALAKKERKRSLILMAASYFDTIMRVRQQHLDENLHRSLNMQYVYTVPNWKRRYNEYVAHREASGNLIPQSMNTGIADSVTDRIIRDTMRNVWDIPNPRDFQIDAIRLLAFTPNTLLYLIAKTGCGKSAVPLTVGTLRSGVTVTLVPLIGLGSDQVTKSRNANHYVEAYHLDEQNTESSRALSKRLNSLHQSEANHCTIILYVSPRALQMESHWLKLLERLAKRGYLRLICIDEAHAIEQDGRRFRPEFVSAAQNLMMLHNMMPEKCSIVCMSATFRQSDQNTVSGVLKRNPDHVMWLPLDRRRIGFTVGISGSPYAAIKRSMTSDYAKTHRSQTLVYTNSKRKAIDSLVPMCESVLATHKITGEVISLTGDDGIKQKMMLMEAFCNADLENDIDVDETNGETNADSIVLPRLLAMPATSAANCGVSSINCHNSYRLGFPPSMHMLLQEFGRVDRDQTLEPGENKYTVELSFMCFVSIYSRVMRESNASDRRKQLSSLFDVLDVLVLPQKCQHVLMEEYFENPESKDNRVACRELCSYCRDLSGEVRAPWNLGRINRSYLTDRLICFFNGNTASPASLIRFIKTNRERILEGYTMGDKSMSAVHALCLLLLRLRIIDIDVRETKKEEGNAKLVSGVDVVLRLGRLNDAMAVLNDAVWASVRTVE